MGALSFQIKKNQEPNAFDLFWSVYPLKHAKKEARKAWARLNPSPELVSQICDHLVLRVKTRQWREGFIPHAATFIRGARWDDELTQEDFPQAKL